MLSGTAAAVAAADAPSAALEKLPHGSLFRVSVSFCNYWQYPSGEVRSQTGTDSELMLSTSVALFLKAASVESMFAVIVSS